MSGLGGFGVREGLIPTEGSPTQSREPFHDATTWSIRRRVCRRDLRRSVSAQCQLETRWATRDRDWDATRQPAADRSLPVWPTRAAAATPTTVHRPGTHFGGDAPAIGDEAGVARLNVPENFGALRFEFANADCTHSGNPVIANSTRTNCWCWTDGPQTVS